MIDSSIRRVSRSQTDPIDMSQRAPCVWFLDFDRGLSPAEPVKSFCHEDKLRSWLVWTFITGLVDGKPV